MALKILYTTLDGSLTTDISSVSTLLPIDAATLATLEDNVDFGSGDWTYLTLRDGSGAHIEEVKATGISGSSIVIVRGASLSVPTAFTAIDCYITNIVGLDAIKDIIAATPVTSDVTVAGTNAANVTNVGSDYNVDVPETKLTGIDGIEVTGTFPNFSIAFAGGAGGCCSGCGGSDGSGGGITSLAITSAILQGSIAGTVLNLSLQTPAFTGAGGVVVTGTYPNFTITGSGSGNGTVTSVAVGTGLGLTGTPTVNPTISLTATGVTAGNYGGFVVNAQGQITALPVGFAPLSSITFSQAITVVITAGVAACTVASSAVGVRGVIALADSGSPLDSTNDTTAVTPKVLANALAAAVPGTAGAGSSTGEADAAYTNTLSTTAITITVAAGKKIALFAECEMLDGGAPLTPVAYGIAIFTAGGVKLWGGKSCTQSRQSMVAVVSGPLTAVIVSLVTTAVPSGSSVTSQSLVAIPI